MTERNPVPNNLYLMKLGDRARFLIASALERPNRVESVRLRPAGWLNAAQPQPEPDSGRVGGVARVSELLPTAAITNRKPWVVSQLRV